MPLDASALPLCLETPLPFGSTARPLAWFHIAARSFAARAVLFATCALAVGCNDPDASDTEEEQLGVVSQALSVDAGSSFDPIDEADDDDVKTDGGVRLDAGGPRDGGIRVDGGVDDLGPLASWSFDDCSPSSTLLVDSSPHALHAQRTASVACAEGIVGQALTFDERRDLVEARGDATFTFTNQLSVAAWVNPRTVTGAIVNKQAPGGSAFELSLERGQVVFTVTIRSGWRTQRISSRAPLTARTWSHVAGVYDGQFVRLFRDGQLVGLIAAAGSIVDVSAPVRIGNNLHGQFLVGRVDDVAVFGRALNDDEVAQRACIRQPATMSVTPTSSGPVDADTLVNYDIAVSSHNVGACSPAQTFLNGPQPPDGFSVVAVEPSFVELASGQTAHFTLAVTGTTDADPGTYQIPFSVFSFENFGGVQVLEGQVEYILNAPTGCFVRTGRELLVRDLSVVEDPVRTTFAGPAEDPRTGAWTFGRLLEQMAPTPGEAPAMAEQLFRTWLSDQTINTFTVPARPAMRDLVLNGWPRTASGELDLTRAPLRLLAVVNRIDVRNLEKGHAGEGRFVFGVVGTQPGSEFSLEFTVILEYRLPARTVDDVIAWANAWHQLQSLPFPSEEYNAALQAITDRFAGRNAEPGRPNGSALGQLRTNEITLGGRWELREFELSPATGRLVPSTVKLTPDTTFMADSDLVARYVNQNEAQILIERHEVPETFEGVPFLGGNSFNDLLAWQSSGIVNPEARHKFSLNTCNGCHASQETGVPFLQIFPREPGSVSQVSGFMSGTTVPDPVTGVPRTFNDLGRRNADLKAIVCGGIAPTTTTPASGATAPGAARARVSPSAREAFLSRGIGRVH